MARARKVIVTCAVTGTAIPLENLRYWSVARQEPYVDAAASLEQPRVDQLHDRVDRQDHEGQEDVGGAQHQTCLGEHFGV